MYLPDAAVPYRTRDRGSEAQRKGTKQGSVGERGIQLSPTTHPLHPPEEEAIESGDVEVRSGVH